MLTPIHINTDFDQPQIDLMLFENYCCIIANLPCLINKNSHMKHVCTRWLFAFSSQLVLIDLKDRCQKQKPTSIAFSYKDYLKFEDQQMKVPVPIRVYADFACFNPPQLDPNNPNVFFIKIPYAVGFYLTSPVGKQYYPNSGLDCELVC